MKKKYIIVLIVLIPALFFIISFIYKEKVHQEYVKNCYKNIWNPLLIILKNINMIQSL